MVFSSHFVPLLLLSLAYERIECVWFILTCLLWPVSCRLNNDIGIFHPLFSRSLFSLIIKSVFIRLFHLEVFGGKSSFKGPPSCHRSWSKRPSYEHSKCLILKGPFLSVTAQFGTFHFDYLQNHLDQIDSYWSCFIPLFLRSADALSQRKKISFWNL